jgi:DNA segregation ATPase FtsK/SpoIIIE, S-DNA-T family
MVNRSSPSSAPISARSGKPGVEAGGKNWRIIFKQSLTRSAALLGSIALWIAIIIVALSLISYHRSDGSFSTAAGAGTQNLLGSFGAWIADAMLFILGPAMALILPFAAVIAVRMWRDTPELAWKRPLLIVLLGIILLAGGLALWVPLPENDLPASWGGLIGMGVANGSQSIVALGQGHHDRLIRISLTLMLIFTGLWLVWRSLGMKRAFGAARVDAGPGLSAPADSIAKSKVKIADASPSTSPTKATVPAPAPIHIADASPVKAASASPKSPRQADFFGSDSLPSPDLLTPAPSTGSGPIDKAALEHNARALESVLADFSVQGTIVAVRPGPVVTMYELEPAPGTKASRVASLADDIARNMSALSARIAPIPGRTVIGIELPNTKREPVVLHDMITSAAFTESTASLPIVLGKNISGDSVVADLAPMPHLLVAGTTGSGKSVGLNSMILSLLYRLTPEQCRMIMIDPKMLELSIYDNIPHLLSPVVTEPQKAIRALKWAVEQMEDRYRMMSSLSVRSLASYNEKVRQAKAKGQSLSRRVQTGFDSISGNPMYEEEQLDYEQQPQIVVIVDELADLMMTAGKEVEFLIQRLAQKARAAGIHLIMATQRPSVDVITGVIKANLPTRISFHVTSKIDSRTILGEQGAEQLLGKGDMLYMPGGKQLVRVHGPFVSDDEVRAVADHWRTKGVPSYIQSVTEEPEDGGFALDGAPMGEDSAEERLYRKACQLVIDSGKASTSWLQRQLRVGYNSAARLIERMEDDGVVSAPDHVNRREVLLDRYGQPK